MGASIDYTADLIWIVPIASVGVLTGTGFGFAIAGVYAAYERR